MKKLEDYVRSIPDFPEEGIIFRDVTTVLQSAEGLRLAVDVYKRQASAMVGSLGDLPLFIQNKRVIIFRTFGVGSVESIPHFKSFYCADGHHRFCQQGIIFFKNRVA